MKVTLINPSSGFVDEPFSSGPPLGLASVAAVLETQGIGVEIVDMAPLQRKIREGEKLSLPKTDIIGISSSMTQRFPQAIAISRALKQTDEDVPIVLGGNHATFMHKEILRNYSSVDIVVLFEGEYSMLELTEAWSGRKKVADVKGIAYRNEDAKIKVTPPAKRVKHLDTLPMPARHLLPMKLYVEKNSHPGSIVSSRGCPYKCAFCSTSAFFGHKIRLHSAERVLQEVEYLVEKQHIKEIKFSDDIFTCSRSRAIELCEMIEKTFDIQWGCLSRVDYVDTDLLSKMRKAGCQQIFFGVESGAQIILDKCRKHQTVETARRAIRLAKEADIDVCASFILGLPGESHETVIKTLDLILETLPEQLILNLMTPYPGTRIYQEPQKFGIRILDKDWQYYTHAIPVAETKDLSWRDLLKAKFLILQKYLKAIGTPFEELRTDDLLANKNGQ